MKEFKTEEEFIEWVSLMHLQNTNGRESQIEMFKLGIEVCVKELKELGLLSINPKELLFAFLKANENVTIPDYDSNKYLMIDAFLNKQ